MKEAVSAQQSEGKRLDVFLSEAYGKLTRSYIKKLIDGGAVTVNGKCEKSGKIIKAGDTVEIDFPEVQTTDILPEDIPLEIVYEDASLAVVNKRQGISVHPAGGAVGNTLVNALLFHVGDLSSINGVVRPGIVHRLDKDTSGLLVVAKNDAAHLSLSRQIAQKTAVRIYTALVEGVIKVDAGKIEANLARHPQKRKEFRVCLPDEGRHALTYFKVLQRFREYTLAEFVLATGRTHQIRVHARHIGHPVVCDPVYGYSKQKFAHKGQLLHAARLEFDHPESGEHMRFDAPLPSYFVEILSKLQ